MWKKITYRNYFLAAIIVSAVTTLVLVLLGNFLPPLTPLFYGRPSGEAQLTSSVGLFIAPGVSLVITAVNLSLSLWTKDDFLKKILAIASITVSVLMAITIIKIIFLVGFF